MKNETADKMCRIIVLMFAIPATVGGIIGTIYSAIAESPMILLYALPFLTGFVYLTYGTLKNKF